MKNMKWLAIGFFLIIVALVVATNRGQLPQFIMALYRFPGGDKVGHFFLAGLLAGFVNLALPLRPSNQPWRSLLLGSAAVLLLATLEELSQGFFAKRTLSWLDWFSSLAGIVCFGYTAWLWRRRHLTQGHPRASPAPPVSNRK